MSFGSVTANMNTDNTWLRNIIITNNATNPAYQVDVTADMIQIENIVATSFSKTADITVSGVNGLDTGTEAVSTWYYLWAIAKADGTVASLLSASSTAPTMPTGYTKKRRISAIYNDSSGNFSSRQYQTGNIVFKKNPSGNNILANGDASSYTAVSAAFHIPPTSRIGIFQLDVGISHGTPGTVFTYFTKDPTDTDDPYGCLVVVRAQVAGVITSNTYHCFIGMNSSQQVSYKRNSATAPVSGGLNINVAGYIDQI